MQAHDILHFWFEELTPAQHFAQSDALDAQIRTRFGATWQAAQQCELWAWRATPLGRLAEILVLDQFSRNIHRGTPLAYRQDSMALVLAQEALSAGVMSGLQEEERAFLLMPYMHSESRTIHAQADGLFQRHAPSRHAAELRHKAVIDRFGRYPHRNAILGRASTDEEIEFLKLPGSSF